MIDGKCCSFCNFDLEAKEGHSHAILLDRMKDNESFYYIKVLIIWKDDLKHAKNAIIKILHR